MAPPPFLNNCCVGVLIIQKKHPEGAFLMRIEKLFYFNAFMYFSKRSLPIARELEISFAEFTAAS